MAQASRTAREAAPVLMWFRDDLRLADNPALSAAARAGAVAALFVLDDDTPGADRPGAAQLWWLHHSLAALARDLERHGVTLLLRRGRVREIVPEIVRRLGAAEVHASVGAQGWLREADTAIERQLDPPFIRHVAATLVDIEAIRAGSGRPYTVYGPFARACQRQGPAPEPLPAPRLRAADVAHIASDTLTEWALLPTRPDWAGGLRATWTPGEAGARKRLAAFRAQALDGYDRSRDAPGDETGTSMLSPHLRWGEISPRQVWHAVADAHGTGPQRFRGELLWHDFAANLLRHNPQMPHRALRGEYERLPWRRDRRALAAWQRGRTGVPIVDAGMRQLWHIGWMHNRVRMIAASWLVKHLLIDWRAGEAWFWDTLVDGDLASNSANWQWVAGSGTEAQPFFRIFNPVLQARKFDADGAYVRAWVPEVAKLPDRWLHEPWAAPASVLDGAGLVLDRDYPRPAVAFDEGRARALAAFRTHVQRKASTETDGRQARRA